MAEDLTSRTFGQWIVVALARIDGSKRFWRCRCACGQERDVVSYSLKKGHSISCGCSRGKSQEAHGLSNSPEYGVWSAMKDRCLNPAVKNFDKYGGRGIRVCERWRNSFVAFYADMGPRPSDKHSIDRIDNDGNYELDNCRWAIKTQQCNNKSNSRKLTFNGRTQTVKEWAAETGLLYRTITSRIYQRGWEISRALTTPP